MTLIHRTIRTSGPDIRLTETNGRGLPIVLLHGSGSSRGVFAEQMSSEIGERHRVIAIDLPGHGESGDAENPELTYTLPGLAGTVGEVLRQMEISRAVFFGWSLGGHVGLELMSTDPVVAGIMLSGTPPIGHGALAVLRSFRITFDSMLASKERFSDSEALRFARACFDDDIRHEDMSSIRRADGRLRKIMFGSMMRGACADEKRLVETSPIPVAMVNGSDDPFFSMSYVARIRYAALWDGMCHVIPDAGHSAFRQVPQVFNPMLMRFADDVAMHRSVPRAPKVVVEEAPRMIVSEQVRLRA